MIVTEDYKTRSDGVELVRTYSDAGYRIIRNDGVVYDEAIDIKDSGYTYKESDEPIEEISAEEALTELLEVLE